MEYFTMCQTPGASDSSFGPFPTYKEAQWRGEFEQECAAKLFADERANLTFHVMGR